MKFQWASDDFIRKGLTLIGSWHLNTSDRRDDLHTQTFTGCQEYHYRYLWIFNAQAAFDKFMSGDTGKLF